MSFLSTLRNLFLAPRKPHRSRTWRPMLEILEYRTCPSSLAYSTYLGGSGNDDGAGIAVDAAGNAYVLGLAQASGLPVTAGAYDTTYNGGNDVFVAKFNPSGSLVWATYLGGSGEDDANGIAVDSSGNVYVTGATTSGDFPTTPGAFQTTIPGPFDAFVTKINATGTALVYSTYLGGATSSTGFASGGLAIAVDASGNAYIGGDTRSSDFPTTSGAFQTTLLGDQDGFVTKLNATGSGLLYSTYLGGTSFNDHQGVSAVAIDSLGNAFVTGESDATTFPTTFGALQTTSTAPGLDQNFVTKLNATGSGLIYSTYLGGSGGSSFFGGGIALDSAGDAYVSGITESPYFPTTPGAIQTAFGGGRDAFVSKLNATGTALVFSTYLGGSGRDEVAPDGGIALDSSGNVYVTGITSSTNFPIADAVQATYGGGSLDAFVTKLNASGTALVYSTYLGGSGYEGGIGLALDAAGNAYVAGVTISTDFPTANPFQAANAGGQDAFVAEIVTTPASPTLTTSASATIVNGDVQLTDSATLSGSNNATGTITFTLHAPDGTTTYTQMVSVNDDGTYTTPAYVVASEVGVYYWTAVYSGDANNFGANDQGGTLEQITTTVQGTGGLSLGFWSNKNGQALETLADFSALTSLNLRTATGANEDFTFSLAMDKTTLAKWLTSATATNMAYKLSAQLAATELDVLNGFVNASAYVDINLISPAFQSGFSSAADLLAALNSQGPLTDSYGIVQIQALMDAANNVLGTTAGANTTAGSALRTYEAALQDVLNAINNNQSIILV